MSGTSLSFGTVPVGQTATATLSISNNGSAALEVSQIQFSSQEFSLAGQVALPLTLEVGQSYNLTLEFAPTAAGAASGSVTLAAIDNLNSASSSSSATVALSGTGEAKTVTPGIELQPGTVSFGDVQVSTTAAEDVTITSSGTAALTISALTITGSGFTVSGLTPPATLNPGQTVPLQITFDPGATGPATGTVSLTTNTSSGSATIDLSGTGVTLSYEVDLAWDSPSSPADPPVGYKIFRAVNNSTDFTLLNSTADKVTTYIDTTVLNGDTYSYYVESVDAEGNLSVPSDTFTVTIPN